MKKNPSLFLESSALSEKNKNEPTFILSSCNRDTGDELTLLLIPAQIWVPDTDASAQLPAGPLSLANTRWIENHTKLNNKTNNKDAGLL